jgi:hypothetical protein
MSHRSWGQKCTSAGAPCRVFGADRSGLRMREMGSRNLELKSSSGAMFGLQAAAVAAGPPLPWAMSWCAPINSDMRVKTGMPRRAPPLQREIEYGGVGERTFLNDSLLSFVGCCAAASWPTASLFAPVRVGGLAGATH